MSAIDNIVRLAAAQEKQQRSVLTEDSIALAFTALHQGQLLYDHELGTWFRWDGVHWEQERTQLAFDWVRSLSRDVSETEKQTVRKSVCKSSFASGVERFARADRTFAVTSDIWDSNPFLLATPSGTVELVTGVLRAADPADHISKLAAVVPSETADCPRWLAFLSESTGEDAGMIRFLQQWCGYSLTGDTREHQFAFVYGPGGNGKTTFINTINGILGDYATVASMDCFTTTKYEQHPTDLAMLRGARVVTAAETAEGRSWNEQRIKELTGGDKISARFMRQDFFRYVPTFKLMIIGNHVPNLRRVDDAERRRINIIPFVLKPKKIDKLLVEKLKTEWPGILRWMIDGCLDWQNNGLIPAKTVTQATKEYFENQDLFAQWLEEKCDAEPGNEFKTATSAQLFKSWMEFTTTAGEESGSRKGFAALLEQRGFQPDKINPGMRIWRGLRLKVDGYDDL
jgi:putative DNA primase/helicase